MAVVVEPQRLLGFFLFFIYSICVIIIQDSKALDVEVQPRRLLLVGDRIVNNARCGLNKLHPVLLLFQTFQDNYPFYDGFLFVINFDCVIICLSIIGKELRGYLIALFYLSFTQISDTIVSGILGIISINFSNCPGFMSGFFVYSLFCIRHLI